METVKKGGGGAFFSDAVRRGNEERWFAQRLSFSTVNKDRTESKREKTQQGAKHHTKQYKAGLPDPRRTQGTKWLFHRTRRSALGGFIRADARHTSPFLETPHISSPANENVGSDVP